MSKLGDISKKLAKGFYNISPIHVAEEYGRKGYNRFTASPGPMNWKKALIICGAWGALGTGIYGGVNYYLDHRKNPDTESIAYQQNQEEIPAIDLNRLEKIMNE